MYNVFLALVTATFTKFGTELSIQCILEEGELLVIPVEARDTLSTIELIDGQGRKAALSGRSRP